MSPAHALVLDDKEASRRAVVALAFVKGEGCATNPTACQLLETLRLRPFVRASLAPGATGHQKMAVCRRIVVITTTSGANRDRTGDLLLAKRQLRAKVLH